MDDGFAKSRDGHNEPSSRMERTGKADNNLAMPVPELRSDHAN